MRRWLLCAALIMAAPAHAEVTTRDEVNGGDHWRIVTAHGAMHVWRPAAYDADVAGVVVYIHGYYTNVDEAWTLHKLADQFAAANKNALFVVPEAPVSVDDDVKWPSLGDVLRAVFEETGMRHPGGPLVVVGHSASYRTIVPWLDYTPLNAVILLDALYGNEEDYFDWLNTAKGHAWHRLTLVALDTSRWAEPFVKRFAKEGAALMAIPEKWEDLKPAEQRGALGARVLYVKSQFDHMKIVTEGKVIPVIMKRAPLRDLPTPPPASAPSAPASANP